MPFPLLQKTKIFSGNALKIIAAAAMLIDHIGFLFFPFSHAWMRCVGRLAFPLFAFFIAEGCRYTKNRARYFCLLAGLAIACQAVVQIAVPETDMMSILMTFSFSVLLIYALQYAKDRFAKKAPALLCAGASFVFIGGVVGVYFLMEYSVFDYGFWGCMTPVFASLLDVKRNPAPAFLQKIDLPILRALCMLPPLLFLTFEGGMPASWQAHALLSLGLLCFYNGKRGKWNMKYFFYIFYPAHLVILYGILYFFF